MKIWTFLSLVIFLFISCDRDDDFLDEISNPDVLRSAFIDVSNLHLAFPSIVGNEDRSKIIVTYREGTDHISWDGKIIQMESFDKGKTWLNRKVIYQAPAWHDARDPQMLVIEGNKVLCRFFERISENQSSVKCIVSTDFGKEYNNLISLPYPTSEKPFFAAARGNMVIIDGVIYTVCYNRWSYAWLMKSENNGRDWHFLTWLNYEIDPLNNISTGINETSLGYMNGKMYLVARQASLSDFLQVGISENLGLTWQWGLLSVKGEAPSLTPYKDAFILTYRQVDEKAGKYGFTVALFKEGKIVSTPVTLFFSDSFDIGYGDVLTLDDSFLVCCYMPNKIQCYEIKYSIFD